jgi:hypothetical protein
MLCFTDCLFKRGNCILSGRCFVLQIAYLRERWNDLDIGVDGGVSSSTIQQCAEVRIQQEG